MAIFDFGKKEREEKARLSAEEEQKRVAEEEERKRKEEEERKRKEEEERRRQEELEKDRQEALALMRIQPYVGFMKYTDVKCEVFAQAGFKCSYDDIEFTAEIAPEDKALKFRDEKGQEERNFKVSFDIKMVYVGGNKCALTPRIIFQEMRYNEYREYKQLSKVYLKNGENRYVLNISDVSTVSYNSEYSGHVEEDQAVYIIGVKTVDILREMVSPNNLDKAIRVGYHTKRLAQHNINRIKGFLDVCERAGIFEQEFFKIHEDSCVVLTKFNEETNV